MIDENPRSSDDPKAWESNPKRSFYEDFGLILIAAAGILGFALGLWWD